MEKEEPQIPPLIAEKLLQNFVGKLATPSWFIIISVIFMLICCLLFGFVIGSFWGEAREMKESLSKIVELRADLDSRIIEVDNRFLGVDKYVDYVDDWLDVNFYYTSYAE